MPRPSNSHTAARFPYMSHMALLSQGRPPQQDVTTGKVMRISLVGDSRSCSLHSTRPTLSA